MLQDDCLVDYFFKSVFNITLVCSADFVFVGSTINTIDKDVQKLLCEDLQSRSDNLTSELTEAVEVMKSEPNTFDSFTAFSKVVLTSTTIKLSQSCTINLNCRKINQHDYMQVKHSVNMSDDLKKRVEDLLSLQETVQRNYTYMAPDGVFLMKQVHVEI